MLLSVYCHFLFYTSRKVHLYNKVLMIEFDRSGKTRQSGLAFRIVQF
jgi:hypothetical protein